MTANTPEPPYYAVIFYSKRSPDRTGYVAMAERMVALASMQPGYLGIESVREHRIGITVSYWRDEAAISAWKNQVEHMVAQEKGERQWYDHYAIKIAKVERAYSFSRDMV